MIFYLITNTLAAFAIKMQGDNREDVFQLIPAGMGTETRRCNQSTKWLAETCAWHTNKCEHTQHKHTWSYTATLKT